MIDKLEKSSENPNKNRMLILINVVLMTFIATLQSSIINVALPVMAGGLSVSSEAIAWVVTAYLIVITSTILIFGKLGDFLGITRVFMAGIAMFTLGSLLCGISASFGMLIAARIVQGIGAAGAMATNQGIIAQTFPKNERGKALGISGSFVALGSMVGPPLGGFFVSLLSWHYVFIVNVPIGIFVFILGTRILPANIKRPAAGELRAGGSAEGGLQARADEAAGAKGGDRPREGSSRAEGGGAGRAPILQLGIFRNKVFSLSIFCALISFIAISCSMIIQPFYLQNVMKYSPAVTGFIMMANPLILLFVAPVSGHLSDRIGSELLTFLGLAINSTGLFLMSMLTEHSSLATLLLFISIMSLGSGMFQSPNTSLIMSSVPHEKLGIAGSLNAFMRNLGMVLGTAFATTLLYDMMSARLGYQVSDFVAGREDVFIYGMKYVYIAAAVICALGAALTAYRMLSASSIFSFKFHKNKIK